MATRSREDEFGSIGEEVLRAWLLTNGYWLVPASLINNGGAPKLEGYLRDHVLPDFLAARNAASLWIDAKSKRRSTWNQKRQRHETGCELRHFQDYLAVQKATGIPGAIAFIHCVEQKLYLGRLDEIAVDHAEWHHDGRTGHAFKESMAFFDLNRCDWYDLQPDALFCKLQEAATPSKIMRVWEKLPPPKKPLVVQRMLWENQG